MSNSDAKREHLARAAEAAAQFSVREAAGSGWGEPPDAFLAAYYRHVAAEDILARSVATVRVGVLAPAAGDGALNWRRPGPGLHPYI